jgi:hypothetical protein
MPDELLLITPVNDNFRRDVELADITLLDPNESDSLIQGEWLSFNTAGKAVRHSDPTTRGAMQIFTPKGDTSGQAIGKTAVLQLHEYEAETSVFDDGISISVGSPLTVGTITLDTVAGVHSGLLLAVATNVVYGVVTRLPADNNGKLRYMKSVQGIL